MRNFTLFRSIALLIAVIFVSSAFAQGTGGSEEKAYSVAEAQAAFANGQTGSVWVKGYIVGYVDGSVFESGCKFDLTGDNVSQSNILLADSKTETDYTKCIPVQLKNGTDFRSEVNLVDNPRNLGQQLVLKASLEAYFRVAGLKDPVTDYKLSGSTTPDEPTVTYTYGKATTVESGATYLLAAPVEKAVFVAKNASKSSSYSYLYCDSIGDATNTIELQKTTDNFILTAVEGGYTIQDSYGRYIYMDEAYNTFRYSSERTNADVWTVAANSDGTFKITNVATNKYIQYSLQYKSYGVYVDEKGVMPYLYKLGGSSTGIVSAVEDVNAPVEVYTLSGIKVGSSLDGLKGGIYLVKKGNKVQKVLK